MIQFTVKNEQKSSCGGGYIKLLPKDFDQKNFSNETPYLVMFGPDVCAGEHKAHIILPYKGKNYSINSSFKIETDNYTHQYTLIISPNGTFEYLIDNKQEVFANISDYFDFAENNEYDVGIVEGVGIDIIQSTPGTIFDNIFIGNDVEEAKNFSLKTFKYKARSEPKAKKAFDDQQEQIRKDYNSGMDFTNFR